MAQFPEINQIRYSKGWYSEVQLDPGYTIANVIFS